MTSKYLMNLFQLVRTKTNSKRSTFIGKGRPLKRVIVSSEDGLLVKQELYDWVITIISLIVEEMKINDMQ